MFSIVTILLLTFNIFPSSFVGFSLLFFGKFRETYAYMIDFSTFFPNECTEGYTYLLITLATCSSFDVIIMIQFKNIFEFFSVISSLTS